MPRYDIEIDGEFGGMIEFSIVLPAEMPHYVRQSQPADK